MEIRLSITKRHLVYLSILCFLTAIFFVNANVNSSLPWHPLQQISTMAGSNTSVDDNNDGIIDNSNVANSANVASVANSVAWGNIQNRPAGLDDGDDVGGVSGEIHVTNVCDENGNNCKNVSDGWTYLISILADYSRGIPENSVYTFSCPSGYDSKPVACSVNNADVQSGSWQVVFTSSACRFTAPNCYGASCDGTLIYYLCRAVPTKIDADIPHQFYYIHE